MKKAPQASLSFPVEPSQPSRCLLVPLADGRTVGETLPTSVALCARSLLYNGHIAKQRAGVYALGDPRPTHQELCWSEAEAHTLAKLACDLGLPVDASCHGRFDANDFLQSSSRFARGGRLTLADAFIHKVDLPGLRLLILSARQTAILDLRGARDEVRSLAAGMVQAGARAVLVSLWSVDDKATYLLIVRFAQE